MYKQSGFRKIRHAFTLIELLTVVTIIIILTGLVLSLAGYARTKGARSRAQTEIAAMSTALESYKADNGVYPEDNNTTAGDQTYTDSLNANPNKTPINGGDPTQPAFYNAGLVLYRALSGDRNLDGSVTAADESLDTGGASQSPALTSLPTVYMSFKPSQLLAATPGQQINASNKVTQLVDPFGYSYGYSTYYQGEVNNGGSTTNAGYNPTYDLWCTCGTKGTTQAQITTNQPSWITNW